MELKFQSNLSQLKESISKVKDALIKNSSIPIIFDNYKGQIILAKNKLLIINSTIFIEMQCRISINSNVGICVPDEFYKYIEKIKAPYEDIPVNFHLINDELYVSMEGDSEADISTSFFIKIIHDIEDQIPSVSNEIDIENIPDLFYSGISFCSNTVQKSSVTIPESLIWCNSDKIFSTDMGRISVVDLNVEFTKYFSLLPSTVKFLKSISVDQYAVDKKYVYFFGSGITVGSRQYNFEPPVAYLEMIEGYEKAYDVKIPKPIIKELPKIKIVNDKNKSPDVRIIESGEHMEIHSKTNNTRKKSQIIVASQSENKVVGELIFELPFIYFDEMLKLKSSFFIDEEFSVAKTELGENCEFSMFTKLSDKTDN